MTTPSDAAIARAFWITLEECQSLGATHEFKVLQIVQRAAEKFDAGSPENPCPLKVKDD